MYKGFQWLLSKSIRQDGQKTLQINQHPHFKPSVQKKARYNRNKNKPKQSKTVFNACPQEGKTLREAIKRVLQHGGLNSYKWLDGY